MRRPIRDLLEAISEQESTEFQEKLLALRARLPERQRDNLDRIIVGADAAFKLLKTADPADEETASFWKALFTFRDELPLHLRDTFTSILTAGSVAWGVAAGRPGHGGPGRPGVIFSAVLHLLVPVAVIVALGSVIVRQLIEKNTVKAEPPDLTGIKPTPEEPEM
jgi:hypothetical protein